MTQCNQDLGKVKSVIYIPQYSEIMCISIRRRLIEIYLLKLKFPQSFVDKYLETVYHNSLWYYSKLFGYDPYKPAKDTDY